MGLFIVYGLLQERIMTTPYRRDAAGNDIYFDDSTFIVLCNRLLACLIALAVVISKGSSLRNVAPLYTYGGISISNFLSSYCQYEALKYVNFPTQTLSKCVKMLPVMIVGSLLSGKKYSAKDYITVICITAGCASFMLSGNILSHHSEESPSSSSTPYGLFLMGGYTLLDGFTSTFQEMLFKGYTMSTFDQMIYVNGFSSLASIIVLMYNRSLLYTISFITSCPQLAVDILVLSICAALGQMVICYMIKEFGALIFSAVMVTRQVLSIVLSCVIYYHPTTNVQFASATLVVVLLYYKCSGDIRKHATCHEK